jgi:hypothetical protein
VDSRLADVHGIVVVVIIADTSTERHSKSAVRIFGCCTIALMMEAVSASETSVNFYQTTRHNIQENSRLHVFDVL